MDVAVEREVVVEVPQPLGVDAVLQLRRAFEVVRRGAGDVRISLGAVRTADAFGLAALAREVRALRGAGRRVKIVDMGPEVRRRAALLRALEVLGPTEPVAVAQRPLGAALARRLLAALDRVVVLLAILYEGLRHGPRDCSSTHLFREQLVRQVAQIGARAVPIVVCVMFLVGSIMAVQVAHVVEPYGGTVFVARGVALSMTRELGPLLTAVLLAGRSGSAIAAELGAMVVYEEVQALEMMGLHPRRFLLSPRFVALCVATPSLVLLADLCGILGGAAVMTFGYGVSPATYYEQTLAGLEAPDVVSGLIKAVSFGALIAAIACRRGLALRGGPEAVGRAATGAVVDGIIAVVVFDAVFTILTKQVL